MHVSAYTSLHMSLHMSIHMSIHISIHMSNARVCAHVSTHVHAHVHTHVYSHVHTHVLCTKVDAKKAQAERMLELDTLRRHMIGLPAGADLISPSRKRVNKGAITI